MQWNHCQSINKYNMLYNEVVISKLQAYYTSIYYKYTYFIETWRWVTATKSYYYCGYYSTMFTLTFILMSIRNKKAKGVL